MRSDAVIPGSVAAEVVLIRTDQVAVAVGSVRAYPNGFELTVHVRLRGEDEVIGPGPVDPFGWHRHRGPAHAPDEALRLGVMYADGRRVATDAINGEPSPGDDPERLVLCRGGGGGDDRRWDADFWVYPLPPEGPVTLVASWLERGITEARTELDGAAIRQAAQHAVILWPDEPEPESQTSWRTSTITASRPDQPGATPGI
jgi:hypothetical protein